MKSGLLWLAAGVLAILSSLIWLTVYDTYQNHPLAFTQDSALPPEPEHLGQKLTEPTSEQSGSSQFVPILMYHYIRDYKNPNDLLGEELSVSPSVFERQLVTLKDAGYQAISLTDFAEGRLKEKSVILTFDDGYKDHYTEALPILQKQKMTGTFFIVSGFLGKDQYMDSFQVASLKAAGMELGGHTISHKNLANTLYEKSIEEIGQSLIGRSNVFAYPAGKYSYETLDIVSGLGIKAAVTTNLGIATEKSKKLELPRIRVKERTDILKRITEETAVAKRQLAASNRSPD